MKRLFWRYFFVFLLFAVFITGAGFGLLHYYEDELPPLWALENPDLKVASEVYDRNGNLIYQFALEKRSLTSLEHLPQHLIDAVLVTEDENFYDHWGVDLRATVRALVVDVIERRFAQGASTITQQLARNLFLHRGKTIPRKIKELLLAVEIEKIYSKEEILEMYLNKVLIGPGIYGVEEAAAAYFGKDASQLNLVEAATIAGNIQLPSRWCPTRYPENAFKRRNIVLKRMYVENKISREVYEKAIQEPVVTRSAESWGAVGYFIDHVRQMLEQRYGTRTLHSEGLKIYTTLDIDLQNYADSVLNAHLTEFENTCDYDVKYADFPADTTDIKTGYVQGSVFFMDVDTGEVRVMIGGRNFSHSKFNRALQAKRQPGSAFKPILYTRALEAGYTPATVINDNRVQYVMYDGSIWEPGNYENDFKGYIRMREALRMSRNIYAIKMITDVGPQKVMDKARDFGLTTNIPPYYSLAVGSAEVVADELVAAYSAFAAEGRRVKPVYITKVVDAQGKVLEEYSPVQVPVMERRIAFLMNSMLQTVVNHGTGYGVRRREFSWPAGGKTGTTNDYRDAWYIGFTRDMVGGVWVGFDDNSSLGRAKSGAVAALPPWPYIMKQALILRYGADEEGEPLVDSKSMEWAQPPGIERVLISKRTGLLPRNQYEDTVLEYFIQGTAPTALSDSLGYNLYPTKYRDGAYETTLFIREDVSLPDSTLQRLEQIKEEHAPMIIDLEKGEAQWK